MPTINQLSKVSNLSDGDLIPIQSETLGDARAISAGNLASYVNGKLGAINTGTGGGSGGTTVINSNPLAVIPKTNVNKLWEKFNTGEPIYSTPIFVPDFTSSSYSGPVFIYQSWDWYLYVIKISDGSTVWRYPFGNENYGRAQYVKIGSNQYIFGASHDGNVYCLNQEGTKLWDFKNLYDREGSGSFVYNGLGNFTDVSKDWATNSFIRSISEGTYNANITITIGSTPTNFVVKACSGNSIDIYDPAGLTIGNTYSYVVTPKYESDVYYQHAGTVSVESGVGYLYVTGFDNQCVKLSISGSLIWKYSTLENIEPFPLINDIDNDGVLECVFSSVDGKLYVVNAVTGVLEGSYTGDEGFDAYIKVGQIKGTSTKFVVSGCRDGRVYSINGTTKALDAKSTSFGTLAGNDIDAGVALFDNGNGTFNVISVGDAGFIVCLDYNMNVLWRIASGLLFNSTPQVAYIQEQQVIIACDMAGAVTIISGTGTLLSQFHVKGGIEGTPYIGDVNGDGYQEMMITTLDGNVYLYRLTGIS